MGTPVSFHKTRIHRLTNEVTSSIHFAICNLPNVVPISLDSQPPANAGHCIPVLITEVNSDLTLTLPEIYDPPKADKQD